MATSQERTNETSNDANTTTESERDQIRQTLLKLGFTPRDYTFRASEERTADHPSAFSKYPRKSQSTASQLPSINSGRSLSYVQQPPPPPPVIRRQASNTQSPNDMSQPGPSRRRTPPPPPRPSVPYHDGGNSDHTTVSAEHYLRQIDTLDNPPVKVIKPNEQNLVYRKEIRIRYLQPPTPPPPAPIIIREKQIPPNPPASPLLIRERKPEPITPPPLTIRERPPSPPPILEPYIIDKPLPPPPTQPRQIIIERLPSPPPKPRSVVFEKWLPYKKVKRPILLEKAPPIPQAKPTRNVIIEYEPAKAYTVRRVIEEGIFRVDPHQYSSYHAQHHDGNVRIVDRIDDLPPPSEDLMRVLRNYDQSESARSTSGIPSNIGQLMNISHAPSTPVYRQERVHSSGDRDNHHSTILSPTFVPLSNTSPKSSQDRSPEDTPKFTKSQFSPK